MFPTHMLSKHHRSLSEMANELSKTLDGTGTPDKVQSAIIHLSRMAGLLALHLAMEDKVVQPALVAVAQGDSNSRAGSTLQALEDTAGLKEAFGAYRRKWMQPDAIRTRWAEFADESRPILQALRGRIQREEIEFDALSGRR